MKLLGSLTSPYVRRIRLLLADAPYDFVNLNIYGEDRDELRRNNPALKIPMIQDGEQAVYDSRVIARYLSDKYSHTPLNWDDENRLTLIDAANDSFVAILLSRRSGIDTDEDVLFYNLQNERIRTSMQALATMIDEQRFAEWHYPAICLYCLVDWIDFRDVFDFTGMEALLAFRDQHRNQPMVAETDPRAADG